MKLQISFDLIDLDKAIEIAKETESFSNTLEIGTLLLYHHGVKAIERFRSEFPEKKLVVNTNILDRGKEVVELYAKAGADFLTVMAGSTKEMIHATCTAAHNLDTKIILNLLDAPSLGQSALEAQSIGADILLFKHTYKEADHFTFIDQWNMVRGNSSLPIFISGNITEHTIDKMLEVKPDTIVIGRAITEAENPAEAAQFFIDRIKAHKEAKVEE